MLELKDGTPIQKQFTSYAFDSAPPRCEGDCARIRLSTGQLVEVTLRKGPNRSMWLVGTPGSAKDYTPRPSTPELEALRENRGAYWTGESHLKRQNAIAAKVAAALAAKRAAK